MYSIKIVKCFFKNNKILILKRSNKIRLIKGLWSKVSGIIEKKYYPVNTKKVGIFERLETTEDKIEYLKSTEKIKSSSVQCQNHEGKVCPFLFETKQIERKLN